MVINYEEYFEQAGFEKSLSIASYDFTAGPGTCPVTGVKAGI